MTFSTIIATAAFFGISALYNTNTDTNTNTNTNNNNLQLNNNRKLLSSSDSSDSSDSKDSSKYTEGCFTIIDSKQTFDEGVLMCQNLGLEVASIHSFDENNIIDKLTNKNNVKDAYVAMNDETSSGMYSWLDNSITDYTNWNSDELAKTERKQCTIVDKHGEWETVDCAQTQYMICRNTVTCPATQNPYLNLRTITIAVDNSYGDADLYCTGDSCHETIQEAICKLKGLTVGEDCGLDNPTKSHPDNDETTESRGGVITMFPGTYDLKKNIVMYSNIVLQGEGIDQTILKLVDDADSFYSDPEACTGGKAGLIRATKPSSNMVLRGMTLDGNRHNQPNALPCADGIYDANTYGKFGFFVEAITDMLVEYVKIVSFHGYGFDPHGIGETFQFTERLTIQHCIAEDNGWDGYTLDKLKNSVFTHNLAKDNGRHGINIVTGTRRLIVSNNQVIGNGNFYVPEFEKDLGCGIEISADDVGDGCGIKVQNNQGFRTSEITITNNFIEASDKEGICLNNVHSVIVSNNQVFKSYKCISMSDQYRNGQGVREALITNNICDNSGGVKIAGLSENNVFSNNNIRVKYKSAAIAFQVASNIEGLNQLNLDQNYYINVADENREVLFEDEDSPNDCTRVIGLVTDREESIKELTDSAVMKQFDFDEDELEHKDLSALQDYEMTWTEYKADGEVFMDDKLPLGDATLMMIVDISSLDYYPTAIKLTCSTNSNYGLEFDIEAPITGSDEDNVLMWKLGLNMIKHKIVAADYYIKSSVDTFDTSVLDTLKVYRSNYAGESEEDYISFELIQIGKTNGFA